jgi:hypothetical protein
MSAFDALYKQTVTVFNRVKGAYGEDTLWYPTVIEKCHLIVDKASTWSSNGGRTSDNARLHVRYTTDSGRIIVASKQWYEPKAWANLARREEGITFRHGDNDDFDFFMEGVFDDVPGPISDEQFDRKGFYNYMNKKYDNVFAITSVSKYNLIPHFEITAR